MNSTFFENLMGKEKYDWLDGIWKDKWGKILYTIVILFIGGLLTSALVLKRPIEFWLFKMNVCTDTTFVTKVDTIYKIVHDTVTNEAYNKSKKIDVKSFEQKGGQTAGEITNH